MNKSPFDETAGSPYSRLEGFTGEAEELVPPPYLLNRIAINNHLKIKMGVRNRFELSLSVPQTDVLAITLPNA